MKNKSEILLKLVKWRRKRLIPKYEFALTEYGVRRRQRHVSRVVNNGGCRVRETFLQLTARSYRRGGSLFMGNNETRDNATLTINFISDCDNDVTLLYLPSATGSTSTSTPLIKPPLSEMNALILPLHYWCNTFSWCNWRMHKHILNGT